MLSPLLPSADARFKKLVPDFSILFWIASNEAFGVKALVGQHTWSFV